MEPEDKPRFVTLLTGFANVYNKEVMPNTFDLYWKFLADQTYEEFQHAVYKHVKDPKKGQFWPKIADLLYQLGGELSLIAWAKVMQAISIIGSYKSIVFDDHLIHVVIKDMGGWIKICGEKEESMPFIQRDFERFYNHYSNHKPDIYPRELIGRCQYFNESMGYPSIPPSFYGDEEKALLVYHGGMEPSQLARRLTGVFSVQQLLKLPNSIEKKLLKK